LRGLVFCCAGFDKRRRLVLQMVAELTTNDGVGPLPAELLADLA
jgi:hypothetical protein